MQADRVVLVGLVIGTGIQSVMRMHSSTVLSWSICAKDLEPKHHGPPAEPVMIPAVHFMLHEVTVLSTTEHVIVIIAPFADKKLILLLIQQIFESYHAHL